MRWMILWCASAALAGLAGAGVARADLELTGTVAADTYSVSNEDIYLHNATITAGPGGTTLTLIVNNGKIMVGTAPGPYPSWGVDGRGSDGADSSGSLVPAVAGGAGFNIVLITTSTGGAPTRDCGVYISKFIECGGGLGGDGYSGQSGRFVGCDYVDPEDSTPGAAGGNGGSITISALGPVASSGVMNTSGGSGGYGGSGGGGTLGPAEDGQDGGAGGNGGAVSVSSSSTVTLSSNVTVNGSIASLGGPGGGGGYGGTGPNTPPNTTSGSGVGGDGGSGGNGGAIAISGSNFSMTTASGQCHVNSTGGNGGAGGGGGDGIHGSCYTHECPDGDPGDQVTEYPIDGYPGADSGAGGPGGDGGNISVTASSTGTVSMGAACRLTSNGGDGAVAGSAGQGGLSTHDDCKAMDPCALWEPHDPGMTMPSGDGGDAGDITVGAKTLTLAATADMRADGGDGALGVNGAQPLVYCCPGPTSGEGSQGGAGGDGGSGGDITLTYTTFNFFGAGNPFVCCGGAGRNGGNGSFGTPPGAGGVKGVCGTAGVLRKNTVVQSITCSSCSPSNGSTGGAPTGSCPGS